MVGQTVGNYRIVAKLGEGGVGEVYLGEHPDIGRKVAIKIVRRALAEEPTLYGRFLAEARATNAIQHPNIVEVLDFGRLPDGQPYIVMEYLPGESLAARLERVGALPVGVAVDLATQVAGVLTAAHFKAIVHRDLKPDNVFLVAGGRRDGGELVKVLDFGIAKLQGAMRDGSPHTRTGSLVGTPLYMSPEQCRGIREIDARTDIYALGIMLFEMVAGQPPFVSQGLGDLMDMHMNRVPPPLRSLVPGAPPALEALIARALSKRPEDRFASAAELHTALQGAAVVNGGGRISAPEIVVPPGTPAPLTERPVAPITARDQSQITAGTLVGQEGPTQGVRGSTARWLAVGGGVLAVLAAAMVLWPDRPASRPSGASPGSRSATLPARPQPAPLPQPPAPAPPPPAPPAPAVPATVTLRIDSQPAQAAVVDASTGAALGTTPLTFTRAREDAALQLRLTKPGFRPGTVNLRLERDATVRVPLAPQPRRPRAPTAGLEEL